ncbi:apoptosis antagonizing transcription factor-domain-containing protein [Chaetomium sp. MPI-SDFR-AT-0129]|nr:apoptosis antagonizing transcription factor-domain-containing protein [Chaetomium sp. MPI-SDFR-AT-0129]
MPTARNGRARRFDEFEEKIAKDFDIENEIPDSDDDNGSEDSADENAGTEHYVAVGKSKLRQKDAVSLGPEYRGSRVSRAALEDSSDEDVEGGEDSDSEEEFDDPETADLEADNVVDDEEISSENAFCESDDEHLKKLVSGGKSKPKTEVNGRIKKRATAADFMSSSEGEEEEDEGEEDGVELGASEEGSEVDEDGAQLFDMEAELSGEDDDGEEDEDEDDEEDEDEDDGFVVDDEENSEEDEEQEEDDEDDEDDGEYEAGSEDPNDERAQLRKMATEGHKSIVAAMSQAAKADAEKGVAVRAQRRAFDSILNLRIRLQKALVAANSFSVVDDSNSNKKSKKKETQAYEAAEEAAVKLWNTIDSVRHTFMPESSKAKIGDKRKREIDASTPSEQIWESMQAAEAASHSHRRKVLDKWSERVKQSNAALPTRKLVNAEAQTLVSALDEQLLSSERLVKRARTPRSCAPVQAAKKVDEDPEIYDDADFYQLLLKELVDQRSSDSGAPGDSVATVRWAALKETKTRKTVDRRASKGRKLRYTVHEKLQNFMAPEDRRSWEDHAIDRLFGTLFGQKMELREDEDGVSDEEMGGVDVEEEGLRLFRN